MHYFKTPEGKQYSLQLNINISRSIKNNLGIDLFATDLDQELNKILLSPILRIDMMYLMVVEEIAKEDFEAAITGDSAEAAQEALSNELVFFIQSLDPLRAKAIQKTLELGKAMVNKQAEWAEKSMQKPEMLKKMERMQKTLERKTDEQLSKSYSRLEEYLESTPDI